MSDLVSPDQIESIVGARRHATERWGGGDTAVGIPANHLYKAVRPNGTSFHDPGFRWLPTDGVISDGGWPVKHPKPAGHIGKDSGALASGYLSLATVPTNCTGMAWPCLLLAVEPVGEVHEDDRYRHKRRVRAARVVEVLDPHEALGPQGREVAALIDRCWALAAASALRAPARDAAWAAARDARAAARDAAWAAAQDAARDAAWDAAWDAARAAARDARAAARDAARALVVRDLISREDYDALTLPWRTAIGPIHPDDAPLGDLHE